MNSTSSLAVTLSILALAVLVACPPKDWGSFSMSFRGKPDAGHDLCPACVTSTAAALAPNKK